MGKAYAGPREALRLTGKFVLAQLLLASGGADAAARVADSPFVAALEAEVRESIPSIQGLMWVLGYWCSCHAEMDSN